MAINLDPANLFSRSVRANTAGRNFRVNPTSSTLVNGKPQILWNISNHFQGFATGLVLSSLPFITWSITTLWELVVQTATVVWYFDWNAPDDQLDRQAQQQWNAYGSIVGSAVGNTIGWLACGVLPATSMFAFNEGMAAYVLREVGEEAYEELIFNVASTIRFALRNLVQQGFLYTYQNVRRWLKNPDNPILDTIFPNRANEIRSTWGEADAPQFTFAQAVEERIEQIPSQFWRNFVEEAIDEAFDACVEAGYVVTSSVDGFLAQQRIAQAQANRSRVVEVTPNRANDREKLILAGPEDQVRASLPATIAQYQMIDNRDIGQIVGMPVDDYVRDRDLSLRIKFQLFSEPAPPYRRVGSSRLVEVTITIPEVRRAALDWLTLKQALGGPNGYLWGRFKARARLSAKQYVTVYGATADEAEDRLRAIMQLSDLTIETINVIEERRADERLLNPRLQKETTRVYPGFVTVINRQRVIAIDQGRAAVNGNYFDRSERFELWSDTPPPDFSERLQEVLRYSD